MEWLQTNAIALIGLIAGWIIGAATTALIVTWRLSGFAATLQTQSKANGEKMDALVKAFAEHEEKLNLHLENRDVHTTLEQRQAIDKRFDRIETTMATGHANIEHKIDRLTDRILLSQK